MTFFRTAPAVLKISSAAPLLRTLSSRSLGYACLILIALVSRGVLAQESTIEVTFQPGEFNRSVPVAPGAINLLILNTPAYICEWPSIGQLQTRISGVTEGVLNRLESHGTASGADIVLAMRELPHSVRFLTRTPVSMTLTAESGIQEVTFANNCLELADARNGVFQIRRVIRAHLGLPAPTVAPTVSELPASTKPVAIKPAATGLNAPVQIRP